MPKEPVMRFEGEQPSRRATDRDLLEMIITTEVLQLAEAFRVSAELYARQQDPTNVFTETRETFIPMAIQTIKENRLKIISMLAMEVSSE